MVWYPTSMLWCWLFSGSQTIENQTKMACFVAMKQPLLNLWLRALSDTPHRAGFPIAGLKSAAQLPATRHGNRSKSRHVISLAPASSAEEFKIPLLACGGKWFILDTQLPFMFRVLNQNFPAHSTLTRKKNPEEFEFISPPAKFTRIVQLHKDLFFSTWAYNYIFDELFDSITITVCSTLLHFAGLFLLQKDFLRLARLQSQITIFFVHFKRRLVLKQSSKRIKCLEFSFTVFLKVEKKKS